jgi:uncharacterized protein
MSAGELTRRQFVLGSLSLASITALQACALRGLQGKLLSAFEDARGQQYIGGVDLATHRIFGTRVPMRTHGCTLDPLDPQRAVFFARRPGTDAFELRLDTHQARRIFSAPSGRHLAGHGVFSADGRWLLTPEHDYAAPRGVLSVRDTRNFEVAAEIDTGGIDPHEIAWLPGGLLLVANGGILTHPRTFRRKLNIPTMDPSLSVFDGQSLKRLEQWRLPDHLLSIRHLAVSTNGGAAVGLQYEGERQRAPGVVAWYRRGVGLELLRVPPAELARLQAYVASVAVSEDADLIAAACPFGNGFACWSLQEHRYLGFQAVGEIYGLARSTGGVLASRRDGHAYLFADNHARQVEFDRSALIHWDDHWVAVS